MTGFMMTLLFFVALIVLYIWGVRPFTRVRKTFCDEITEKLSIVSSTHPTWVVGGMMGSGKSTFAKSLASQLSILHVEIDCYSSEQDILNYLGTVGNRGWIAEANPWQIPVSVVERATVIIFLDYDNLVNYLWLLMRGCKRWKSCKFTWAGFRKHIVNEIVADLWRIVYLYGNINRRRWRKKGLIKGANVSSAVSIRCISPAELGVVQKFVASNFSANRIAG
jgi:adenylate kinase family enzyme